MPTRAWAWHPAPGLDGRKVSTVLPLSDPLYLVLILTGPGTGQRPALTRPNSRRAGLIPGPLARADGIGPPGRQTLGPTRARPRNRTNQPHPTTNRRVRCRGEARSWPDRSASATVSAPRTGASA